MTPSPNAAAPDLLKVAREACAELWPAETEAYLCGHLDRSPAMETAIKVARAMQEAMSAQGGGEVLKVKPLVWEQGTAKTPFGLYNYDVDERPKPGKVLTVALFFNGELIEWVVDEGAAKSVAQYDFIDRWHRCAARPAPEVKDAAGEVVPAALLGLTFAVQHNPNCPSPWLVRLPGKKNGVIDFKPYPTWMVKEVDTTGDILGFGKTFEDAARSALSLATPQEGAKGTKPLEERAWLDLVEKEDRTSPADYPDHALITRDELATYMGWATDEALGYVEEHEPPSTPAKAAASEGLVERLRDASDDPYFQMTPGVEGWLKRNWALREAAAARIAELEAVERSYAEMVLAVEQAQNRATAAEAECRQVIEEKKRLYDDLRAAEAERDALREERAWRPMEDAPTNGKHCILAVPEPSGFIYQVQGAFQNGQWNAVHRDDVKPLAWMPTVRLPERLIEAHAALRPEGATEGGRADVG